MRVCYNKLMNQDNNIYHNWEHLNTSPEIRGIHHESPEEELAHEAHTKSIFYKFFIIAGALLLLAMAYAGYEYYSQNNTISNEKINLNLNIEQNIKGGQMGKMTASVLNNNKTALIDAVLTIRTQKGFSIDGVIDQDIKVYNFGQIVSNVYTATDSEYIFNGQEGDKRLVSATLEYKVAGSNSIFKKDITKEVKIISPSVIINIYGPDQIIGDHEYVILFKVKNVSYTSSVPLALKIDVPAGFTVKKENDRDPTLFEIKNLAEGMENEYKISGYFKNILTSAKNFTASVSTYEGGNIKSLISESMHEVELVASPIEYTYKIKVNSSERKSFEVNGENSLEMNFKNISKNYILDMSIIVDNGSRRYVYNKDSNQDLARVNPDEARVIEMFISKDVQSPITKFNFEVYGKTRGGEASVLLKRYKLDVPTI